MGRGGNPVLRAANNVVLLGVQNLAPPIFPFAKTWNAAVVRYMPASLRQRLEQCFAEDSAINWTLPELQWEVNAGIGAGVSLALIAGFLARRKRSGPGEDQCGLDF